MAVLSADLREAAFRQRKTQADESIQLEEVGQGIEYAILLAPHVFPTRAYMPFLRE